MKSSAIGIVFDPTKKKVLLVQRRDVPIWVLPGGGVDKGETPELAVLREIHEETGLRAEIVRKTAEYTPINKLAYFTHVFECKAIAGNFTLNEECRNIAFMDINALPKAFFLIHKDWLLDCLLLKPELIKKPLEGITYWRVFKYFLKHPIQILKFGITLVKTRLHLNNQ